MIVSTLKHSERIESLHPLFKTVFDYIKSHDLLNTTCGRIELVATICLSIMSILSVLLPSSRCSRCIVNTSIFMCFLKARRR